VGLSNVRERMEATRWARTAKAAHAEENNKWLVSLAVMFGALMGAIDTSVVNVALPDIMGNVGATQQEITWIATGYLTSLVILMPLTNWLSTVLGRKRVYIISLIVFTAASFMCGTSHTLSELILWRVVQGLGAGTLQPLAQAIFREAFPLSEQGMAMALFGFVVMSGPAIGPTLGGWITDNFSWPWIFFINIPIGVIGYFAALRYLKDPPNMKGGSKDKVDFSGILLMGVGLATLQIVLEEGETLDWTSSNLICVCTAVSAVTLIGFVWRELTFSKPAVDLRILKSVPFTAGSIMGGILGIGLFAGLFLLPQYMQLMLGFNATQAGLALMPRSLVMMMMMPVAGRLFNVLGPRPMIASGLTIVGFSQWMMASFTLQTSADQILVPQVIQGFGFALTFVSLSTTALAWLDRSKLTSGAGLYNLIRQIGGSFGTALVVTVLDRRMDLARANLVRHASPHNPAFGPRFMGLSAHFISHGYPPDLARKTALTMIDRTVQGQATMIAYDYIFWGIGVLFFACLPLAWLLKAPPGMLSKGRKANA
jgi:DHA2 family multidrug resistance protein